MKCDEIHRFLDTYLDGELDFARQVELEQHLAYCPLCQSLAQERQEFRAFFAASGPRYKAPPRLEAKVLAAVRREQAKQKFSLLRQPWVYATAVVVVSVFLALNILFPDAEKELSRQAVLCHSHSLSTDHLVDLASPNPAVIKPWLTARLDFAPPVVGAPASGYSLLGGRVDVIQNRSVATLVYKHDKDVVTLFCWPPKKEHLSKSDHSIEGYQVCTWSNAQCNYILVSKLSDQAMDEFVDSFRVRVQSGAYF
ncbi:MAG: anti-sigma factor [Chthoniobacterales bacterium]